MSALRPPAKQARVVNQSEVRRTEPVPPSPDTQEEKNGPITSSPTPEQMTKQSETPSHPKGHKVRTVEQVWEFMDPEKNKQFLRLTDTPALYDVWIQPKEVTRSSATYVTVLFCQIISSPHLHFRDVKYQMSADDMLKLFYLTDQLAADAKNGVRRDYDSWLTEKVNKRNSAHGLEGSDDRALLCEFIFNEDEAFSLYPIENCNSLTVFFRKICYHSYKSPANAPKTQKIINPSMIKCHAARGKFEYMLEARIIPLPEEWKVKE